MGDETSKYKAGPTRQSRQQHQKNLSICTLSSVYAVINIFFLILPAKSGSLRALTRHLQKQVSATYSQQVACTFTVNNLRRLEEHVASFHHIGHAIEASHLACVDNYHLCIAPAKLGSSKRSFIIWYVTYSPVYPIVWSVNFSPLLLFPPCHCTPTPPPLPIGTCSKYHSFKWITTSTSGVWGVHEPWRKYSSKGTTTKTISGEGHVHLFIPDFYSNS